MDPRNSSVFSFENASGTHLIVTFSRDDSSGLIIVDVYGRDGNHDAEKRLAFGAGIISKSAGMMKAEIEKAKQQISRTVNNRRAMLDSLESMSKGQL